MKMPVTAAVVFILSAPAVQAQSGQFIDSIGMLNGNIGCGCGEATYDPETTTLTVQPAGQSVESVPEKTPHTNNPDGGVTINTGATRGDVIAD